jgi:hypothetical protein
MISADDIELESESKSKPERKHEADEAIEEADVGMEVVDSIESIEDDTEETPDKHTESTFDSLERLLFQTSPPPTPLLADDID